MNFNHPISLFIELTLLLSSTFASDSDYVSIKVHNYTISSQMADGGCTEDIDIYLITKCGSASDASETKNSDSCSATLDDTYVYTTDECDASSDSFEFVWMANNDCNGNWAAWISGTCAEDYQWAETGSMDIADYECGWNGPYIRSATEDQVAYSLYKPCFPTSEPTPSPTASAASMTFTICIDSDYAVATTDDADKIQVRLWTDDDLYSPSEWRYLTSDSTLFSTSGSCHTFSTFNDIYAQWYLMDFSICSTDGVGITRILYWDMETESQQLVSSFDGDSECIKVNGDFILLDGDSSEGSHTHSKTSDTACQRLSVNLSYYSISTQTVNEADVVDQTETDQFDDATDDCTSL